MKRIGIDVGSTTVKLVVIDESGKDLETYYSRHNAMIRETLLSMLQKVGSQGYKDELVSVRFTGSVGSGIAERYGLPFVQEVVAASIYKDNLYPQVKTLIDIGGEDSKVVIFRKGQAPDLRMNGNCAGGTGAFIDQMSLLLHTNDIGELANQASCIYPIASRCGVFSKTDIQNLISKNAAKTDIAASILHAIAVQTITTLSHSSTLETPILLCGGPFTFIPALRKAFSDYLKVSMESLIIPEKGNIIPAYGSALAALEEGNKPVRTDIKLSDLIEEIAKENNEISLQSGLPVIFANEDEHEKWRVAKNKFAFETEELVAGEMHIFLGIDSGSTTTKIVVADKNTGKIIFTHYCSNDGNPIQAAKNGLAILQDRCKESGTNLVIDGSCSTGYGENLLKAALGLDFGIVETIAHFRAASSLDPKVSFLLDIGGQDMKAVFIDKGAITHMEINEACSSGCGSFLETFASSLGYSVADFAKMACTSLHPANLGTRCTVFMNSKVKQALREGYCVADIAAGLSYSVVKNCIYKVLKLKKMDELGKHIVVQGGTMCNDSIVRAFEILTGTDISRSNHPELMGAYGCVLYSAEKQGHQVTLDQMLQTASFETKQQYCKGCENNCVIERYKFGNGNVFFSGNKCEKIFNNRSEDCIKGENIYDLKNKLLFDRASISIEAKPDSVLKIGIPRCLNMFEDFPFWHTLLTSCGIDVILSHPTVYKEYEKAACYVMSDNICFPAKVVHSHIKDLEAQGVDRILMPFVVFEKKRDGEANSYNCPIVTGYSEVIRNVMPLNIPFDEPVISFKDKALLRKQCLKYLASINIPTQIASAAIEKALKAQNEYEEKIAKANADLLGRSKGLTIMLAGRPYHTDMLTQHKLSNMIAEMGVNVISDDLLRLDSQDSAQFVAQWSFPNRILKAAQWVASKDSNLQFVQMTSFGCGPDAFLTDEIKDILGRSGKALTLMKIDDINNVGSMRLRIRSLIESLMMNRASGEVNKEAKTTPIFTKEERIRKIIFPYFTPFLSPFISELLRSQGYESESLPMSDRESSELGLQYANNEVCYPATLLVGDIIKAFKSGKYDPKTTAVAFVQTGGQCRATNYLPLIKKALIESGYDNVPVISLTFGGEIDNEQPGFEINWLKILPAALRTIIYGDCLAQFYYATLPREKSKGSAKILLDSYIERGNLLIKNNKTSKVFELIREAALKFKECCKLDMDCPTVGIVGEIFLKFNSFAHREVPRWLAERGIAVAPSMLTYFFTQYFVNRKADKDANVSADHIPDRIYKWLYGFVLNEQEKANRAAKGFPWFIPLANIYEEAGSVSGIIKLNTQFGEGWLLPAEIAGYVRSGVNDVISLQPFGCIANHIVSKGLEKRFKEEFPKLNLLSLDFDSGVSDTNVINRLLLFTHSIYEGRKNR
jgi:predicted CoA-substrate-specific enzyme activase